MKSYTTSYNRPHHVFAVFVAVATFIVLIAGALVTSNDAGLSVPDWPTSFGSFRMPHMVGGVLYEHGHRMIAFATGVLTIGLAVWTCLVDKRSWIRKLALAGLGTIVLQGMLGGLTVLEFLPPAVSTAHALVGQTFFCIAVIIALFTSRRYVAPPITAISDSGRPSVLTLAFLSVGILYLQLALGGMFRHNGMGWAPHVVNAVAVAVLLTWTATRVLSSYPGIAALRRPALLLLYLLLAQIGLGFLAFLTKVVWGAAAVQPGAAMVWSTVAHVVMGALLLATMIALAAQLWSYVGAAKLLAESLPGGKVISISPERVLRRGSPEVRA